MNNEEKQKFYQKLFVEGFYFSLKNEIPDFYEKELFYLENNIDYCYVFIGDDYNTNYECFLQIKKVSECGTSFFCEYHIPVLKDVETQNASFSLIELICLYEEARVITLKDKISLL